MEAQFTACVVGQMRRPGRDVHVKACLQTLAYAAANMAYADEAQFLTCNFTATEEFRHFLLQAVNACQMGRRNLMGTVEDQADDLLDDGFHIG